MKKILKDIDKPLFLLSTILFIFGLIMIFSSSNITAFMKYATSPYRYFLKQTFILIISFILSIVLLKFHSKCYYYLSQFCVYLIGIVLALLLAYGSVKNQAVSWINFGFFSFQPSELAKIVIIVFLSCYYDKKKDQLDQYKVVLYPIVLAAIIAFFIFAQPDLGTTIIYTLIVASIFFMAPISQEIRNKMLLLILGGVMIAAMVLVGVGGKLINSEQLERFDFKEPCSKEKFYGSGNQVCNGYIAINHGGLLGTGLGQSTQKYLYLPEAHTDFIFAIIVEELGFVSSIILFVLYFLLIGRIIKIGKDSYNTRGFLICMGVAIYIVLHIFVNLGGILGVIPMTGVPLPFMSYGGSFSMSLILALTLVQRINVENRQFLEKKQKKLQFSKTISKKSK